MKSFAVVALALIFAPAALAQHQTFVNPDASDVKMKLNTTHEVVNGTFPRTVRIDQFRPCRFPYIWDSHRRSGQRQNGKRQPR